MARSLTVVNSSDHENEDFELQFSDGTSPVRITPGEAVRLLPGHQTHIRVFHLRDGAATPFEDDEGVQIVPAVEVAWDYVEPSPAEALLDETAQQGGERSREEILHDAIPALEADDFTSAGVPKVEALQRITGLTGVTAEERDTVWSGYELEA